MNLPLMYPPEAVGLMSCCWACESPDAGPSPTGPGIGCLIELPAGAVAPPAGELGLSDCSESFLRDLPPNSPLRNPLSFFTAPPPVVVPLLLFPPELAALTLFGGPGVAPSASDAFCLSLPFPFLLFELVETADERPSLTHARFFSLPSLELADDGATGIGITLGAGLERFGLVWVVVRGGRDG
jgi:hypothetical protein